MSEIIPRREDGSQAALAFCEKCGSARIFEDTRKSLFADTGNWENCFACKQYRWFFRIDQHCRIVNKRTWQWGDPRAPVAILDEPSEPLPQERTANCYPTAEEINGLPDRFRQYIHDLQRRTDKSRNVEAIALLQREDRDALQKRVEELEADFRKQNADLRRAVFEDILRDPSCVIEGIPLPIVRRMVAEYQEAGLKLDAPLLEQAKANPFAQRLREDREALQRRVEELESDLRKPREEFRAMVLKDIENRLLEQQQDDARRAIERIRFWIQG